jgi:hypothetical protein
MPSPDERSGEVGEEPGARRNPVISRRVLGQRFSMLDAARHEEGPARRRPGTKKARHEEGPARRELGTTSPPAQQSPPVRKRERRATKNERRAVKMKWWSPGDLNP